MCRSGGPCDTELDTCSVGCAAWSTGRGNDSSCAIATIEDGDAATVSPLRAALIGKWLLMPIEEQHRRQVDGRAHGVVGDARTCSEPSLANALRLGVETLLALLGVRVLGHGLRSGEASGLWSGSVASHDVERHLAVRTGTGAA